MNCFPQYVHIENFDTAVETNRKKWLDEYSPESLSSRVPSQVLEKIIGEGNNNKKLAKKWKPCDNSSDSLLILLVQERGNQSQTLAKKRRRWAQQCTDILHGSENETWFAFF